MEFFGFLGKPLGYVMAFIYKFVPNYFITIFIFTFLVRLCLFPLSLKQQKSACDRAKLAPRLERLQKKYAHDRNKLAEKQQALYEKYGVSMTGGCLPMLLSFVVLFGVIAAIYAPLTNLSNPSIHEQVISVAQYAIIDKAEEGDPENTIKEPGKVTEKDLEGYYGELRLMTNCEKGNNHNDIVTMLNEPTAAALQRAYEDAKIVLSDGTVDQAQYDLYKAQHLALMDGRTGEDIYAQIVEMSDEFKIFDTETSLLDQPWTDKGFAGINWLWIIPLVSGATSFLVSFVSMGFQKKSMPKDQPGAGCTNNMMMIYMPAISTWMAFVVPGAVGVYWIFSNLLSMLQTVILNKIYDPAKARLEAEAEYQERRRKKAEDKKRLAQARQREEAEARKAEQAAERQREESRERERNKRKKKGGGGSSNTPADNGTTDAVDTAQPVPEADDASED